jgi:probable F420-dependent oxidoreductase
MARPLTFAVQLRSAPTGKAWIDLARRVEDLGYAAVSMPDHFNDQFAPIPALGAIATSTQSVRLTMAVLANDFRHPVVLAKEAATLDVLSGGRLDLGLGAGWMESEYRQAGLPFDRPGIRIERLEETIQLLRALFAGETVTWAGAHYQITEYASFPPPAQPRVPIVLGGGGRRMLSLAGRAADIVSITTDNRLRTGTGSHGGGEWETVARQVGWVRDAAGTRFEDLVCNTRVLFTAVTHDRDAAAGTLAAGSAMTAAEIASSPFALVGTVDQIVDHARRVRDELGISSFTVSQAFLEELAPVVERAEGT